MLPWLLLAVLVAASLAAVVVACHDWRDGIVAWYCLGLLQDPVRKLLPEHPPWLLLLPVPVLIASLARMLSCRPGLGRLGRDYPGLGVAFALGAALLAVGGGVTFSRLPLPLAVPAVGLVLLTAGLFGAGLLLGCSLPAPADDSRRLLRRIVVVSAVFLSGSLIEQAWGGPDTTVLGPLHPRPWLRTLGPAAVPMVAGLCRSPEVAGWHAALLAALAITLLPLRPWGCVAAAGLGLLVCLLSGRRKMIVLPLVLGGGVLAYHAVRLDLGRLCRVAVAVVGAVLAAAAVGMALRVDPLYLQLAASSLEDGADRFEQVLWRDVRMALDAAGWWGCGLGTSAPGLQHFGQPTLPLSLEGGLLRLALEGGLVGLSGFLAVGLLLFWSLGAAVRRAADAEQKTMAVAMLAATAASVVCCALGQQIYGDPLVVGLTGLLIGIGLSLGRRQEEVTRGRGDGVTMEEGRHHE